MATTWPTIISNLASCDPMSNSCTILMSESKVITHDNFKGPFKIKDWKCQSQSWISKSTRARFILPPITKCLLCVSTHHHPPSASVSVHHPPSAAAAAHPLEFEVSRCRTSQFARCFLPAQTRVWNDLPFTVFHTGMLDRFKGAVNRWLLHWIYFSVFPWRMCLRGCVSNL